MSTELSVKVWFIAVGFRQFDRTEERRVYPSDQTSPVMLKVVPLAASATIMVARVCA